MKTAYEVQYIGERKSIPVTRDRAAYLLRAARSRGGKMLIMRSIRQYIALDGNVRIGSIDKL